MNSTTALEGELLLLNQLELVTPTTVAGTLYGIAFTLFCIYVHALVPQLQDKDRNIHAKFMLVYSAVIMICGLYSLVANAWSTQDAYIEHSSYPGGPFVYERTTYHSTVIIIQFTCQLVISTLTSAIQIWRVWVVWSATKYANLIIVLPSLCFLAFTALSLRSVILETTVATEKVGLLDAKTSIAEVAIQGAVTLLCTALISTFLIYEHWRQRKLINKSQGAAGYMNIVAMLIESYALESVWLLIGAALQRTSIVEAFFAETQLHIEVIAYLLVLYRVASGKAYQSQRSGRRSRSMSSLHWNHSHHPTTQFEVTSEAGGDHHLPTKPHGASDGLPVFSVA